MAIVALGGQYRLDGQRRSLGDQLEALAVVGKSRDEGSEGARDGLRRFGVMDERVDRGRLDPADERARGKHADSVCAQGLKCQQVAA